MGGLIMETFKKPVAPKKKVHPKKPRLEDLIDTVKIRAHEIYLERVQNGHDGNEVSDWVKAEEDIKAKHQIA